MSTSRPPWEQAQQLVTYAPWVLGTDSMWPCHDGIEGNRHENEQE